MFSKRTSWDLAESALATALQERRAAGLFIADLTASNPTRCSFQYDPALLEALADESALDYEPEPRGLLRARNAIRAYYAEHDANISPEQIFLTTGTSEGYSFLFRLLCDPGDEVLIAQPSYPLFDFLAGLDNVRLVPYRLIYDHGWQLDLRDLVARLTPQTRAVVLVHPNNPTGSYVNLNEREALESICLERGLALVADEVFLDYGYGPSGRSFASGDPRALTFVLSGLSKICGLPQMKAAWIICKGPDALRLQAQNRLEIIADTFLSMNAPVQCAIPAWLAVRHGMQRQIQERIASNRDLLDSLLTRQLVVSRLEVEAGWYIVLRIPAVRTDEETALLLLAAGVSIHPGYYFGFPEAGWLIISLLAPPEEFRSGIELVISAVNR